MSFDLCQVKTASRPFFIEAIGTGIYSIEELCFYLYENIYLVDSGIMNETLCDWIRDDLDMKHLYRVLYEQLDGQEGAAGFILPIFREIGYLTTDKMREFMEKLNRLDVQPRDMKQKLKADYLVKSGMLESAANEYWQILDRQTPASLGARFYAEVWNNLGCAGARLFRFEQAAECFLNAWKLTHTTMMLRNYISVLPLFLTKEEYGEKLNALDADQMVIAKLQEQNLKIASKAQNEAKKAIEGDPEDKLRKIKEDYRRRSRV